MFACNIRQLLVDYSKKKGSAKSFSQSVILPCGQTCTHFCTGVRLAKQARRLLPRNVKRRRHRLVRALLTTFSGSKSTPVWRKTKQYWLGLLQKTINMFNWNNWKQRKLIRLQQQTSALEKVVILLTTLPNRLPSHLPDLSSFTVSSSWGYRITASISRRPKIIYCALNIS